MENLKEDSSMKILRLDSLLMNLLYLNKDYSMKNLNEDSSKTNLNGLCILQYEKIKVCQIRILFINNVIHKNTFQEIIHSLLALYPLKDVFFDRFRKLTKKLLTH